MVVGSVFDLPDCSENRLMESTVGTYTPTFYGHHCQRAFFCEVSIGWLTQLLENAWDEVSYRPEEEAKESLCECSSLRTTVFTLSSAPSNPLPHLS